MAVKTPKYWEDAKVFGKLIEVETAYGNKVKIPEKYLNGWKSTEEIDAYCKQSGPDPLDGMKTYEKTNEMYYDLALVFYEIYQEKK